MTVRMVMMRMLLKYTFLDFYDLLTKSRTVSDTQVAAANERYKTTRG